MTAALIRCAAHVVCCIHRTGESQGNALAQLSLTRAGPGFSARAVLRLGSLTCLMQSGAHRSKEAILPTGRRWGKFRRAFTEEVILHCTRNAQTDGNGTQGEGKALKGPQ